MSKNDISYEYLINNIHYDKETGIFKKIIKSNNGDIIGFKPTGCTHSRGFLLYGNNMTIHFHGSPIWGG